MTTPKEMVLKALRSRYYNERQGAGRLRGTLAETVKSRVGLDLDIESWKRRVDWNSAVLLGGEYGADLSDCFCAMGVIMDVFIKEHEEDGWHWRRTQLGSSSASAMAPRCAGHSRWTYENLHPEATWWLGIKQDSSWSNSGDPSFEVTEGELVKLQRAASSARPIGLEVLIQRDSDLGRQLTVNISAMNDEMDLSLRQIANVLERNWDKLTV